MDFGDVFQKISDYHLSLVNTITPNETETQYLSGIEVKDKDSAKKASEILIDKGIQNIVLSICDFSKAFLHFKVTISHLQYMYGIYN